MSYWELLESIRELPIADQIALAETILEKVGHTPSNPAWKSFEERDLIRRQMREAAQDAREFFIAHTGLSCLHLYKGRFL